MTVYTLIRGEPLDIPLRSALRLWTHMSVCLLRSARTRRPRAAPSDFAHLSLPRTRHGSLLYLLHKYNLQILIYAPIRGCGG